MEGIGRGSTPYQGGFAVPVYTPQGTKPLEGIKVSGSVRKDYDKASKSQVIVMDPTASGTKVSVPKGPPTSGGPFGAHGDAMILAHPIVVLHLYVVAGSVLTLELNICDTVGRKRLVFSSGFSHVTVDPLHVKYPLSGLPRNTWLQLCLDVHGIYDSTFKGASSMHYITGITVQANGKLRRIFALQEWGAASSTSSPEVLAQETIPSSLSFPRGVDYQSVVLLHGDELGMPTTVPQGKVRKVEAKPPSRGSGTPRFQMQTPSRPQPFAFQAAPSSRPATEGQRTSVPPSPHQWIEDTEYTKVEEERSRGEELASHQLDRGPSRKLSSSLHHRPASATLVLSDSHHDGRPSPELQGPAVIEPEKESTTPPEQQASPNKAESEREEAKPPPSEKEEPGAASLTGTDMSSTVENSDTASAAVQQDKLPASTDTVVESETLNAVDVQTTNTTESSIPSQTSPTPLSPHELSMSGVTPATDDLPSSSGEGCIKPLVASTSLLTGASSTGTSRAHGVQRGIPPSPATRYREIVECARAGGVLTPSSGSTPSSCASQAGARSATAPEGRYRDCSFSSVDSSFVPMDSFNTRSVVSDERLQVSGGMIATSSSVRVSESRSTTGTQSATAAEDLSFGARSEERPGKRAGADNHFAYRYAGCDTVEESELVDGIGVIVDNEEDQPNSATAATIRRDDMLMEDAVEMVPATLTEESLLFESGEYTYSHIAHTGNPSLLTPSTARQLTFNDSVRAASTNPYSYRGQTAPAGRRPDPSGQVPAHPGQPNSTGNTREGSQRFVFDPLLGCYYDTEKGTYLSKGDHYAVYNPHSR